MQHKATRRSLKEAAPALIKAISSSLQAAREQESITMDTFLLDTDNLLINTI